MLTNLKNEKMKKLIYIFIIGSVMFTGCTPDSTGDVSGVTSYAVFDYIDFEVIPLGGTFTPSATASEAGNDIPVTVGGDVVNTSKVGVYGVSYSATNSDGFSSGVTQTVVVHDPEIIGSDVTGAIEDKGRPSRTGVITLIEGTTSIFHCTDFGFGGAFPVYFQMNGDDILDIPQPYINGVTKVDLTYSPTEPRTFTTLIHPQGFAYTFVYQQ